MCYNMSMAEMLRRIAIDTSSLRDIVETERIYVDKTRYLLDMIRMGKYFFLSRPRRFGKSLMVDTLANIFSGNKELFKDTYIYDKCSFESYPVVRLNMNMVSTLSEEALLYTMKNSLLLPIAKTYGVESSFPTDAPFPSAWLSYLITALSEKYGKQVVVLVDEYDYPLLDSVDGELYGKMKIQMNDFYSVLKPMENDIRFCFLTGITRFPHVSIFSKLNNLIDITNSPRYASICGYTDEELDKYFGPYMEKYFEDKGIMKDEERKTFRSQIKDYYDGYRFSAESEETLYNPVSIGKFFMDGCYFENYWISTGAQSLVDKIVSDHPEFFREGVEFSISPEMMKMFKVEDIFSSFSDAEATYSYLLQSGYLTIRDYRNGRYVLDYPNMEVRETMNAKVLRTYGLRVDSSSLAYLRTSILREDTENMVSIFHDAFVNIPYDMFIEKENNYQIAFYAVLMFLGFEKVEAEERTNIGRMDIAVTVRKGLIYIIELKLDDSADKALRQIKEKKYYEKYKKEGNKIHLLGINFSSKERNITEWKEDVI